MAERRLQQPIKTKKSSMGKKYHLTYH